MNTFYRNGRLIEWNPDNPVITCLMSVYNGETYLREAMDSILDQTFTNFEFLIINDGSTDDTVPIIESYDDPRIRLIHNDKNIGLTKSLNKGIDLSKGKYIARMDADDVSMENRFEKQVTVIERNKSAALVATKPFNFKEIYSNFDQGTGEISILRLQKLLKGNLIFHGSVLVKKKTLLEVDGYDERFEKAQDYDLWLRISKKYPLIILDSVLYLRRYHENSISSKGIMKQEEFAEIARKKKSLFNFLLDGKNLYIKIRYWHKC
jgi:glycosyltransferase involved in cell wall biosynthesis